MKNSIKKIISSLLVFVLFFQAFAIPVEAVGVTAGAAIAIDHDTGDVFYAKNADKMMVPASLTKILTTYIIYQEIEAGNLRKDTMVKVSPAAARMSRDKGYPMAVPLQAGKSYSVDQFIKLIMIPSASASCYAMAEHISGTEAKFVDRMNKTAKDLGMEARFSNSHGAKPHYTTARSMAKLVSHFIDTYPDILNYTSLKSINFNGRTYNILNQLITKDRYEGADGFKTGTISAAGYCLAATAKRNGRRVITIVFKSSSNRNRYVDSRKLLDFAFAEQNKADRARKASKIEFENLPEQVRLNTDIKLGVKLSNINQDYMSTGGWTLNGEVQREFGRSLIKNNRKLNTEMHIPFNAEEIKIGFYLNQPDGSKKEVNKIIKISDKEPAMYRDIDGNWAESQIEIMSQKGLLGEVRKGYFGAKDKVRRADFITSLGRLVEYLELEEIDNKKSSFSDVKEKDYFNKYVAWAEENNIIEGYNGRFNPKGELSRQEAAIIIDKLFEKFDMDLENNGQIKFKDKDTIKSWATPSVERVVKAGLINLPNDDNFSPERSVYRTDLAYILSQTLDLLEDKLRLIEEGEVEDIDIKSNRDEEVKKGEEKNEIKEIDTSGDIEEKVNDKEINLDSLDKIEGKEEFVDDKIA